MKRLLSERCLLREWTQADLDDLTGIFFSSEVAYLAGFKVKQNENEVQDILKIFIRDSERTLWAIEYQDERKAIGWIEIHPFDGEGSSVYKIGFVLNKNYWGKGIMPEVIRCVLEEVHTWTNVTKIICSHYDYNEQSRKVIEKCGFCYEKQTGNKLYYCRENNISLR